jgi:hypothetical protein
MEQLVYEDAGELGGGAVERDAALAEVGACVDRAAAVLKTGCGFKVDGAAAKFGKTTGSRGGARAKERVAGEK